jgi:hypothetical protein
MLRYMGGDTTDASSPTRRTPRIDDKVLNQLGLAGLIGAPTDPRLLVEHLLADDKADAKIGSDDFARGIRRAVRLWLAKSAGLHRRAGKTWVEWVREHFSEIGYETYQRFHVAGELQVGLLCRGLPPLTSTYQSRALAPFRKHSGFWDALSGDFLKNGFPPRDELRRQLQSRLGLPLTTVESTARTQLHRALRRAIKTVPASCDDPTVGRALSAVNRAIAILAGSAV